MNLNLASLGLTWSFFAWSSALFAALALFSWWIIRKRLRDFWLPIVRVFSIPVSRLPRIVLQRPPMIPFLIFLLLAILSVFWSLRPSQKVRIEDEPDVRRIHVFIDMSPSVSAQVSVAELGKTVVSLLDRVSDKAKVSFGTSHGDNIYEMTTPSAAGDLLTGLGFHRGGSKIGTGIRSQLTRVGKVDQLFIVSDRDQHSWTGFQWQYLTVDSEVNHVDLDDTSKRLAKPNVFIQDVRYLSTAGSTSMDWEIEISVGVPSRSASGTLTASVGGEAMATATWEVQESRRTTVVSIAWPAAKVKTDVLDEPIEWLVDVTGGDLMQMDNKFLTPIKGRRDLVVLLGEPAGELRLEDPLLPLETALRVSGYSVARYDRWPMVNHGSQASKFDVPGVLVLMGGDAMSLDSWCPVAAAEASGEGKLGPLWLTPRSLGESFKPMCQCLTRLGAGVTNDMCEGGLTRNDWITLLRSLGAKQVGGEIGSASGSVAMMLSEPNLPRDFLLFTAPAKPIPEAGLTWGLFPIMIKDLMLFSTGKMFAGGTEGGLAGAWPRISDVSKADGEGVNGADGWVQIFRTTNVPVGESLMAVVKSADLPSSWAATMAGGKIAGTTGGREIDDSQNWVTFLVMAALLLMVSEILWFWRESRIKKLVGLLFVLSSAAMVFDSRALYAQAQVDILGYQGRSEVSFRALAKEVASRTSLELAPKPGIFSAFDDVASASPWLWTNGVSKLSGKDGRLSDSARLWLKRGGILILDGSQPAGILEKFIEPLMLGTVRPTGWMAMPPDHEFMRSFYLLNSLPTCKGRGWRVFSFDGRVAAIETPYSVLSILEDRASDWKCEGNVPYEQHVRIFVNLMMTAFTTDYKRDQIHLPEILKRLRVQ
jgi:hypothetical protein